MLLPIYCVTILDSFRCLLNANVNVIPIYLYVCVPPAELGR